MADVPAFAVSRDLKLIALRMCCAASHASPATSDEPVLVAAPSGALPLSRVVEVDAVGTVLSAVFGYGGTLALGVVVRAAGCGVYGG